MNISPTSPNLPDPLVEETRGFWREMGKNLVRNSINPIDEAAKQIIGVAGILEELYFHAITFSNLRGRIVGEWQIIIYLSPIVLLLISLRASLLVFFRNAILSTSILQMLLK